MSVEYPLFIRLVAASVSIASRAGQIIREISAEGDLNIVDKGKNDYQTEADRQSERCIVGSLRKSFPKVAVIGEENVSYDEIPPDVLVTDLDNELLKLKCPEEFVSVTESDITVWVDPLDGTFEFTKGMVEHVTVLIGIAVNGSPVAGVMHQPFFEKTNHRTLWGIVGIGTGGFEHKLPPHDQLIIVTTYFHANKRTNKLLSVLKATKVLRVGGAGYKVLLLLEGKAHSYIYARSGCKRWDTCAPEAILRATGGQLTDTFGNRYDYSSTVDPINSLGFIASTKNTNHSDLVEKTRSIDNSDV